MLASIVHLGFQLYHFPFDFLQIVSKPEQQGYRETYYVCVFCYSLFFSFLFHFPFVFSQKHVALRYATSGAALHRAGVACGSSWARSKPGLLSGLPAAALHGGCWSPFDFPFNGGS